MEHLPLARRAVCDGVPGQPGFGSLGCERLIARSAVVGKPSLVETTEHPFQSFFFKQSNYWDDV